MKRRLYIGTNTKMFQTGREAEEYIRRMDELIDDIRDRLEFFFIPSFTSLERVVRAVGERIRIGAQNMAWEDRGQFTGEVSPLMLEEIGVRFETAQQKESGLAAQSVLEQLKAAAGELSPEEASGRLWIGYEPVWAIGTAGTPASASYAEDMHAVIRSGLVELFGEKGTEIPVLYGGSVNPSNAPEIIERNGIDGLFIGRSAWDPDRFNGIIRDVLPVFERRADR